MKFLIENLELALTGAGILVIFTCAFFLGEGDPQNWPALALVAATVGVLHGLIFWLVRRRQRQMRRKTLAEVRQMLRDVVNNQLAVIQLNHETSRGDPAAMARATRSIAESAGLISASLHDLSEESLRRWRSQYDGRALGEP